jgi:hypothetical protein
VRTTEQGKPVDARGEVVGTGTAIDGPFNGALELGQKLAGSALVEQCFVRHNLRYWLGRNEIEADACTLASAHEAYRRSGGDQVELLVALIASDAFQLRN